MIRSLISIRMDYYILFGIIAVIVGLGGFVPYYRDILKGNTKPHAFSWLIWGLVQIIAFFAQISKGGGAGAWLVGVGGLACLSIFVFALFRGEKEIVLLDKVSLVLALIGIVLWAITSNPLNAVILAVIVDALGFVPTYRKAYKKPKEETLITYFLSGLGFAISISALQAISLTTVLYPISVVITNSGFIAMVMLRRNVQDKKVH